jgi:hypothetical protein
MDVYRFIVQAACQMLPFPMQQHEIGDTCVGLGTLLDVTVSPAVDVFYEECKGTGCVHSKK